MQMAESPLAQLKASAYMFTFVPMFLCNMLKKSTNYCSKLRDILLSVFKFLHKTPLTKDNQDYCSGKSASLVVLNDQMCSFIQQKTDTRGIFSSTLADRFAHMGLIL